MSLNAIRGAGINLQTGTYVTLAACEAWLIPPGTWNVAAGRYTFIEWFDPIPQIWRPVNSLAGVAGMSQVESDGVNFRLANRTGGQIGALVTAAGSGYTTAPTITASSGGATYRAILGGAVNGTVTVAAGGTNYLFPPILIIPPPPAGGVPAAATATISAGAVNAVTVTDQGAGYTVAPPIFVVNDPRDTTGSGAVLTTTLTGSGTVTAVVCTGQGTALAAVPTLAFSSGSAAASTIMVATSTTITLSGASNLGNGSAVLIPGSGVPPASVLVNPSIQNGLFLPRMGYTASITTAAPTTTTIIDGGLQMLFTTVLVTPVVVNNSNGTISGATTLGTNSFGGVSDNSWIQPA